MFVNCVRNFFGSISTTSASSWPNMPQGDASDTGKYDPDRLARPPTAP